MATELAQDRVINCIDCNTDFLFTAGEQEFYSKKQFTEPKRCASCRQRKKEQREQRDSKPRYSQY